MQRAFGRKARGQQMRGADGIDAFVHQVIALAARHVGVGGDGDVERAFGEIAVADRGAQAEIDLGRKAEKAVELGHQPQRRQRGRGRHRQLAALAAPVERHQRRLQLVEAFRQFAQRVGGRGIERELAVLAVEQRRLQKPFERAYLMADRGRRDAQFLGGAADAEVSGRRLEGPQRVQRNIATHRRRLRFSSSLSAHPPWAHERLARSRPAHEVKDFA